MRHYLSCLAVALVLLGAAWVYAGYLAGVATTLTEAGAEIELPMRIAIAAANLIARYFVFLTLLLLAGALLLGGWLRGRALGAAGG